MKDKKLEKQRLKEKRLKKRKLMREAEGNYSDGNDQQEAPIAVLGTPSGDESQA